MKKCFLFLIIPLFIACTETDSEIINDTSESSIENRVEDKKDSDSGTESTDETETTEESDTTEEAEVEIDLPQTWRLFKVTCVDSEDCNTEGEEMPFQDTYTFHEDKTFLKVRINEGDTINIEGTFKVTMTEFDTYAFNLEYEGEASPEDIEIISSCTSRKEYLFITEADYDILKNNVSACDGPDLFYKQ